MVALKRKARRMMLSGFYVVRVTCNHLPRASRLAPYVCEAPSNGRPFRAIGNEVVSHDDNDVAVSCHLLDLRFVGEVSNDAALKQAQSFAPCENAIDGRVHYEVVGQNKAQFIYVLMQESPTCLIF
jgi:hypothetical protein